VRLRVHGPGVVDAEVLHGRVRAHRRTPTTRRDGMLTLVRLAMTVYVALLVATVVTALADRTCWFVRRLFDK
jgi:hypothetical protein